MTPFDIGTDLSGSIRLPAAYCGVFGLKPTEHRVSLAGLIPGLPPPPSVRLMSCVGPMARSVEDFALLYGVIAGPDGHDTDVPPVPVAAPPHRELAQLRVAVAPTLPGLPVAAAIRNAIDGLARVLADAGAQVDAPTLPVMDVGEDLARAGELIGMLVGAFDAAGHAPPTSLAAYLQALHQRDQSIIAWEQFFAAWDVLLCPASMCTAFAHCEPGAPLPVDGQSVEYWSVSAHATVFNYSGHPAVVVPYGLDADDMPIGVQLVGKRWDEAQLLATARALVELSGAFQRPPGC